MQAEIDEGVGWAKMAGHLYADVLEQSRRVYLEWEARKDPFLLTTPDRALAELQRRYGEAT